MRNIAGLKPTNKVFGYILGALFVIAAAAALIGCGTDEITGGNGNPHETVLFAMDSLAIITPPFTKDTAVSIPASKVKITFTAQTNADSINGFSLFKISAVDTANITVFDTTYNRISTMNNNFEFTISAPGSFALNLYIQCLRTPPHVFFMRLKNIRVIQQF
jgi:hypothetical protein